MQLFKKLIKFIFIFFLVLFIMAFSFYGYSRVTSNLVIKSANNITLYDKNGDVFFTGNGINEWISLDDISEYLIDATIATEDKNFYNHFGFDILRIIKAFYVNITNGKTLEGASTITQQYVKNLFLDFDKTWERKWNELWLTLNVEMHHSKDEILEGYLNTINYGHGMFGIENASKFYFNKSASDLSLAEASILVGIPKSPANYSPIVNYNMAKERQRMVLQSMVKNGYITEDEMDKAYSEELVITGIKSSNDLSTLLYFQDAVLKELQSIPNIPTSFLDTGGLKIYTTLDMEAQKILENNIKKDIKTDSNIQASSIMIDPNNGNVLALVGGRDYAKSQFNRAISSKRQIGSVMKPILYYAALENGFTSSSCFTSEKTEFIFANNKSYAPRNAGEIYGDRPISLAAAISYSDNVYAVKTHMFLGEDVLVNTARRLGITSNMQEVPSLPLGTSEMGFMELVKAYSSFANMGHSITPHLISKVLDNDGNVLYEENFDNEEILNSSIVFILNNLLTSTYDSTFIDYNYPTVIGVAPKLSRKYAVKSGTTLTDSLTIGYNSDVLTLVWAGYDDNSNIQSSDYMYTKNIWADTMEDYLKDKEKTWYNMPSNVVGVLVDPISGTIADSSTKKKKVFYYIKGTEPTSEVMAFDEVQ